MDVLFVIQRKMMGHSPGTCGMCVINFPRGLQRGEYLIRLTFIKQKEGQ